MKPGRLAVLATMAAGWSGVACTAIVLAKLGDTKDFPEEDGSFISSSSSSSSSSSGAAIDECSLLQVGSTSTVRPPNACSECLEQRCGEEVAIACNDGKKKEWFTSLRSCAQNPWHGYIDLDSGADINGNWGCSGFERDAGLKTGETDEARKNRAENCVRDKCIFTDKRECRLCDVWTATGVGNERLKLSNDDCGKCLLACPQDLADCCSSSAMDYYGQACANTGNLQMKDRCNKLAAIGDLTDAGEVQREDDGPSFSIEDKRCALRLGKCFKAHCTPCP